MNLKRACDKVLIEEGTDDLSEGDAVRTLTQRGRRSKGCCRIKVATRQQSARWKRDGQEPDRADVNCGGQQDDEAAQYYRYRLDPVKTMQVEAVVHDRN